MPRETLLDFFEDYAALTDTFVVDDDGYRVRRQTYGQIAAAARASAARFRAAGIQAGDHVVIWSENRAEWIVALWGCLLIQAVVVPVDSHMSSDVMERIAGIVSAKLVLVGSTVAAPKGTARTVWAIGDLVTEDGARRSALGSGRPESREPSAQSRPASQTLAEIIFTSGATAEPKGVTITHRNVMANLVPIEREIRKYRRYERPFHPIRFLNLLPMSHLFGQSMAAFIPPMIGGTVVFSHGYSPAEIVRQVSSRRVSVLVCVPKVLDVLRVHVERLVPDSAGPDELAGHHWLKRWWRYRRVHRLFGWKFWCMVIGAAPLDAELEAFWRKLGFVVVQGYGLTETAPIVTLNHPFRASRGSVGTPIAGVDVKIAADGEILVRGENVTSGYYVPAGGAPPDSSAFEGGWFHTGDIGELDSAGRLTIKGRKKEMIVTAQGLNVFPEDVERALLQQPGVKEAGVVGLKAGGEERVHAVLILEPGATVDAIVAGANRTLEDAQRIWSASIWPGATLPRTEGTEKLKRRELQRWASGEHVSPDSTRTAGATVEAIVARFASNRTLTKDTTLDELGLSSLDRVELAMAIEDAFHTTVGESALGSAKTIGDLQKLATDASAPEATSARSEEHDAHGQAGPVETSVFPAWNRTRPSWLLRRVSLPTWILPLARVFLKLEVQGLDQLAGLSGPVVFASNHQSHMDVPTIMIAMPARWRYRVAPAMAKEFFDAHYNRKRYGWRAWFTNTLNYVLSSQFFAAFPLTRRETGTRETLRYIGETAADGYSILIFPEGKRTEHGEIAPFQPGVGMIASRLDLPIVPVRLEGLDRVLHRTMKFPVRGPVRVAFGAPIRVSGTDYAGLAKIVEEAVRGL